MIRLTKDSFIYVCAPANRHTGGIELAHQLVDYLRKRDFKCFIAYISEDGKLINSKIRDEYKNYTISKAENIIDISDNLLIIPEIYSYLINRYVNIQIGFWWMSVDNYINTAPLFEKVRFYFQKKSYVLMLKYIYKGLLNTNPMCTLKISTIRKVERITHFYQSAYARYFLFSNKIYSVLPLSDYLNVSLLKIDNFDGKREDIILYNPKKGLNFTKKIIKVLPQYKFIAIENMTRDELKILFSRAKLYIDFGNHPGKDRIPREAAIAGCAIITSTEGAALYFEDIPIDNKYKFNRNLANVTKIKRRILYVMSNYNLIKSDFDFYRFVIKKELDLFHEELSVIFKI